MRTAVLATEYGRSHLGSESVGSESVGSESTDSDPNATYWAWPFESPPVHPLIDGSVSLHDAYVVTRLGVRDPLGEQLRVAVGARPARPAHHARRARVVGGERTHGVLRATHARRQVQRAELQAHVGLEEQRGIPEREAPPLRDRCADGWTELHQPARAGDRHSLGIPGGLLADDAGDQRGIEARCACILL